MRTSGKRASLCILSLVVSILDTFHHSVQSLSAFESGRELSAKKNRIFYLRNNHRFALSSV